MSKVIGIDLGTTNSCVAVMEGGEPVVIPNSEGSRTTPSMVGFTEGDERLVGQIAKRQAVTNPENTVYAVKRLMGRAFDSKEAQRATSMVPYKVVASQNGDAWVEIRGKQFSPPEVSSMILVKMKQTAEDYLGEPVSEAVITVPAYFNDGQRQATKDAGRIAGLNVLRIINEPTAAALAYGLDKKNEGKTEKVAVYDLGGGTFDISILELNSGVFEVKSTNGDTYLGGEDFDNRIIDWLAERFKTANGIDLRKDRMALQRLKEAAERAKHELSSSPETEINLPFITADASGPKHLQEMLERTMFEEMVKELVDRSIEPCKHRPQGRPADRRADQRGAAGRRHDAHAGHPGQGEGVLRPRAAQGHQPRRGGGHRRRHSGRRAQGRGQRRAAARRHPAVAGRRDGRRRVHQDHRQEHHHPLQEAQVFSTATDNQPLVSVHVLQGEREMAADNKTLARFELVGIPPAPRGVPQIEVTFDIDANGLVHVSAKDLGTGRVQQVRIVSNSGLTEAEIQRMIGEAQSNTEGDKKKKELADLHNNADGLIYTTEKSLEEYASLLGDKDKGEIKSDLENLKKQLADQRADEDPRRHQAARRQRLPHRRRHLQRGVEEVGMPAPAAAQVRLAGGRGPLPPRAGGGAAAGRRGAGRLHRAPAGPGRRGRRVPRPVRPHDPRPGRLRAGAGGHRAGAHPGVGQRVLRRHHLGELPRRRAAGRSAHRLRLALTLGRTQLGAIGFLLPGTFGDGGKHVLALVEAVGEILDSAVLSFIALSEGQTPLERLETLSEAGELSPHSAHRQVRAAAPAGHRRHGPGDGGAHGEPGRGVAAGGAQAHPPAAGRRRGDRRRSSSTRRSWACASTTPTWSPSTTSGTPAARSSSPWS